MAKKYLYGGQMFMVDRIVRREGPRVLVFWRGYKRATWEPIDNVCKTKAYSHFVAAEALQDIASETFSAMSALALHYEPCLTANACRVRFSLGSQDDNNENDTEAHKYSVA